MAKKKKNRPNPDNIRANLRFYYRQYCLSEPVDPNLVLIEMFHGQNVSDSGPEFARALNLVYPGRFKIYFTSENVALHKDQLESMGIEADLVDTNTYAYARILATAGYLFANAGLPIFFSRRPGQVYMQTWHGTPLKTLGKRMRYGMDTLYQAQHGFLQATYLTQPNEFTKDIIMGDYNLERLYTGKVVMAGYPRNSVFLRPEQGARLRTQRGLDDKNVFIYMPTWRGTSWNDKIVADYAETVRGIFSELDDYLTDDDIFYVKFHPILRNSIALKTYKHILPFPLDVEPYEFISCADALVTDYSSIFFDFSLTKKPVILFTYDLDDYLRDRGTYFDIHELPFRMIQSTADLGACLRDRTYRKDTYEDTDYYKEFFRYDAADIAERLVALAVEGREDGLTVIDYSKNADRPRTLLKPRDLKDIARLSTIARKADENTVVWLYTDFFKGRQSELIYDHFIDSFDFVITKNTVAITYSEFDRLGEEVVDEALAAEIWQRDLERTLPGLKIDRVLTDFGYPEVGYYADASSILPGKLVSFANNGGGLLKIGFDCGDLTPVNVLLLNGNYRVEWKRKLTEEEKRDGQVLLDLRGLIEDLVIYKGESPYVGLTSRNHEGEEQIFLLKSQEGLAAAPYTELANVRYYAGSEVDFDLPADYFKTNLKQFRKSPFEDERMAVASYDLTPESARLMLLPKADMTKDGFLRLAVMTVGNLKTVKVKRLTGGRQMTVVADIPDLPPGQVGEARLVYRSYVENIRIPVRTEAFGVKNGSRVRLTFEPAALSAIKPVYWDLEIDLGLAGFYVRTRLDISDRMVRRMLRLFNIELALGDGNIIFPYIGGNGVLAFCVREKTAYDNMGTRVKELTAKVLSKVFKNVLKKKNILLVYEKFSVTAQDNSYYLFKYCMDTLTPDQKKNIFYVIDKSAPDYGKVAMYGRHVVPFMSLRHMLYMLTARFVISTDTKSHLYVWRSKPSFVYDGARKRKNQIFLQHGVTALKRVHKLFGKSGSSPMKYFVTTSQVEQDIVVRNFGYKRQEAPILGFTRWDVLEDKSGKEEKQILLMPTWRSWLEDADDAAFMNSDYYRHYVSLLLNDRLHSLLEKYKARLVLCLHPKFGSYLGTFRDKLGSRITLASSAEVPVNEQIMRCAALITDYSSVCWDTLYLRKPVIFYQFDYDHYMDAHGSYIDMRTDLPGYRAENENEVLDHIARCLENNCTLTADHARKSDAYFAFRDQDNCRRTYDFVAGLIK